MHFAAYGLRSTGQLCRVLSTLWMHVCTGHAACSHSGHSEIQGPVRSMHILLSLPWPWLSFSAHQKNEGMFKLSVLLLTCRPWSLVNIRFLGSPFSTIPNLSKLLCLHWIRCIKVPWCCHCSVLLGRLAIQSPQIAVEWLHQVCLTVHLRA